MRSPLVIGNWKMNGCLAKNTELIDQLLISINEVKGVNVVICPPYPYLMQVAEQLASMAIKLGAQNVSAFKSGAYTGEVSSHMLSDLGCSYVLLGHSERRSLFQESDEQIAIKFEISLNAGLSPVLCVGETLEQRQNNETQSIVSRQVQVIVDRVGIKSFANAVIAYEPIWAIGTGETATPIQAQAVHQLIRQQLRGSDGDIADSVQILYGGSVNATNAQALFCQPDIDGGLVGGASLNATDFLMICLFNS